MDKKKTQKKAVALQYDPNANDAPMIAAVGKGHMADRIIEEAQKNDIPVVEDSGVTDVLSQFSIGDAIPPTLYEAVAQILIFISEMDNKKVLPHIAPKDRR